MEDHEQAVVAGIWQGADLALAAVKLCTSQDLRRVEPGFSNYAGQKEQAELVVDIATATAAVMATVNVEDILRSGGQGS